MPRITPEAAARGTAFHEWVAASHEQLALIPDWDLAPDADRVEDDDLAELIAGYRTTAYAAMTPVAVETEISVRLGAMVVRGVIDAVFHHPDGSWEIVDWKTNREQTADPLQLSVYRLGWAQQQGIPLDRVGAVFVYVRDGEVVRPPVLSAEELAELVAQRAKDAVTAQ
jgi:DNA helicase-2/ATP-dependent DNA helicase PcrA